MQRIGSEKGVLDNALRNLHTTGSKSKISADPMRVSETFTYSLSLKPISTISVVDD